MITGVLVDKLFLLVVSVKENFRISCKMEIEDYMDEEVFNAMTNQVDI